MAVSDVGRIAMGSSRSDWPLDKGGQFEHNFVSRPHKRTLA
jgi:hypothetical protein